jgi:hypothetical protein
VFDSLNVSQKIDAIKTAIGEALPGLVQRLEIIAKEIVSAGPVTEPAPASVPADPTTSDTVTASETATATAPVVSEGIDTAAADPGGVDGGLVDPTTSAVADVSQAGPAENPETPAESASPDAPPGWAKDPLTGKWVQA